MPTVAAPAPTATTPPTPGPLAIVDVHLHLDPKWDGAALARALETSGVTWAGSGSFAEDVEALRIAAGMGPRVFPFAGHTPVRALITTYGERAWTLQEPAAQLYLTFLDLALAAGTYRGIGELFANNLMSHPANVAAMSWPADSALMRGLWSLSVRYRVPLSVHMEAVDASVAGMERLLATDRGGTWIWAHCGQYASASLVRRLLAAHSNLSCDLSFRESARDRRAPIDVSGILRPEWSQLFEDMPERFMVGTDIGTTDVAGYEAAISYWRGILGQLSPRTRSLVAHENAERILRLPAR